ncbi:hypothetical protein Runsl_1208 [Runella slithyformis DSM 19594]|uniref:Uncharacterized protein n=1 Tax=Runella slithyformis (strain ATCC 29530 / DSM 19594 / LMG 11500 / NCIMB 11436 / LSU 4) TaxID=761193 RepID=A0A7U4E4L2_RUNSL|nr:hypothetical protein Runsl_1208 [Runella slithyformis DSM 19594]
MLPDNEFFKAVTEFGAVPDFGIMEMELSSILPIIQQSPFVYYASLSNSINPPRIVKASGFLSKKFPSKTQALAAIEYLHDQHKVQYSPIQCHPSKKAQWVYLYTKREQKG